MGVPAWSGLFVDLGEVGFMPIHVADTRFFGPPVGFIWVDAEVQEDHEVQLYRRLPLDGKEVA